MSLILPWFSRRLPFLFLAVALLPIGSTVFANGPHLVVRHVEDGDTVAISDGRWVRYIGINAPEMDRGEQRAEPFAGEAKTANCTLVLGKKVRLELDEELQDQYGRLLAYVFLEDGTFVNARLIELGYAFCLPLEHTGKHAGEFLRIQREAMSRKKGIWGEPEVRDQRSEARKKPEVGSRKPEGKYIGNSRSKRFHLTTCPLGSKTARGNRVVFTTRWDAFWEGFAPCRKCRPWP